MDTLVQHQFGTRLHGGYNLNNWFRADVEIPFYVVGSPQDGVGGARLGDLRLGALVPLLTYEEEGVGVAVKPYFNIPTGQAADYDQDGDTDLVVAHEGDSEVILYKNDGVAWWRPSGR